MVERRVDDDLDAYGLWLWPTQVRPMVMAYIGMAYGHGMVMAYGYGMVMAYGYGVHRDGL